MNFRIMAKNFSKNMKIPCQKNMKNETLILLVQCSYIIMTSYCYLFVEKLKTSKRLKLN